MSLKYIACSSGIPHASSLFTCHFFAFCARCRDYSITTCPLSWVAGIFSLKSSMVNRSSFPEGGSDCFIHLPKTLPHLPTARLWIRSKHPPLAYHTPFTLPSSLAFIFHYCPTKYLRYSNFMSNYSIQSRIRMSVFNLLPSCLCLGCSST